jgi:hypothetical protein
MIQWEEDPILKQSRIEDLFDLKTESGRDLAADMERNHAAVLSRMSPKGALRLEPLLESRRWIVGIPDGAFSVSCAYDRIMVWQLNHGDGVHAKGTSLFMPDITRDKERQMNPRGIIVGAGLAALDALASNGIGLGHVVHFSKLSPIRIPVDFVAGKDAHVCVAHVGDVIGSEDLAIAVRRGLCEIRPVEVEKDGVKKLEHVYVDPQGRTWVPELPWRGAGY